MIGWQLLPAFVMTQAILMNINNLLMAPLGCVPQGRKG